MGQSTEAASNSIETESRVASAVLMIRPAAFARNEVTRPTNPYQSSAANEEPKRIAAMALMEFDRAAAHLKHRGIDVQLFSGRTTTQLPDEVFPNNWITTHPDGTTVLYPLMAWNRRQERRRDILEILQQQAKGFRIDRLIDLSHLEAKNTFLEGTGSLVFDHDSRLAYACLSPRTHTGALREFGRQTEYDIIAFNGKDSAGNAIYHTNIMMALGERFAVVCLDAIDAVDERFRLLTRLERGQREVIEIGLGQLKSFCGNIIQLRSRDRHWIVMSQQARAGFDEKQLDALSRHGEILALDVGTIERLGGGSVRCMIAELLLPRKERIAGAPSEE